MMVGTGFATFDVSDIIGPSQSEEQPVYELSSNIRSITFDDLLAKLRTKPKVKQRKLIGEADENGLASLEERVFGLPRFPTFVVSHYFDGGDLRESEVGETVKAIDDLESSLRSGADNIEVENKRLDCLLEIGDIWYQQQVFEHDRKESGVEVLLDDEVNKLVDLFGLAIDELIAKYGKILKEYSQPVPDATSTLDIIRKLAMQKYWIRATLDKNEKIEKPLLREAWDRMKGSL